jgi:hypothetical protein
MKSSSRDHATTIGSALEGAHLPEFFGHEWFAEFFVRDLESIADKLRSTAEFIDGKAALLHEQMKLAALSSAKPVEVTDPGMPTLPPPPTEGR